MILNVKTMTRMTVRGGSSQPTQEQTVVDSATAAAASGTAGGGSPQDGPSATSLTLPGTYVTASSPRMRVAFRVLAADARLRRQTDRVAACIALHRLRREEDGLIKRLGEVTTERAFCAQQLAALFSRDTSLRSTLAKEMLNLGLTGSSLSAMTPGGAGGGASASNNPSASSAAAVDAAWTAAAAGGSPAAAAAPTSSHAGVATSYGASMHGEMQRGPWTLPLPLAETMPVMGMPSLQAAIVHAEASLKHWDVEAAFIRGRLREVRAGLLVAQRRAEVPVPGTEGWMASYSARNVRTAMALGATRPDFTTGSGHAVAVGDSGGRAGQRAGGADFGEPHPDALGSFGHGYDDDTDADSGDEFEDYLHGGPPHAHHGDEHHQHQHDSAGTSSSRRHAIRGLVRSPEPMYEAPASNAAGSSGVRVSTDDNHGTAAVDGGAAGPALAASTAVTAGALSQPSSTGATGDSSQSPPETSAGGDAPAQSHPPASVFIPRPPPRRSSLEVYRGATAKAIQLYTTSDVAVNAAADAAAAAAAAAVAPIEPYGRLPGDAPSYFSGGTKSASEVAQAALRAAASAAPSSMPLADWWSIYGPAARKPGAATSGAGTEAGTTEDVAAAGSSDGESAASDAAWATAGTESSDGAAAGSGGERTHRGHHRAVGDRHGDRDAGHDDGGDGGASSMTPAATPLGRYSIARYREQQQHRRHWHGSSRGVSRRNNANGGSGGNGSGGKYGDLTDADMENADAIEEARRGGAEGDRAAGSTSPHAYGGYRWWL